MKTISWSPICEELHSEDPKLFRKNLAYYIDSLESLIEIEGYAETVTSVFKLVDHAILEASKHKNSLLANSTCKRSCSACCHVRVDTSYSEAARLWDLNREKILSNRDKIEKLAGLNAFDRWRLPHSEKACVFLENNECSVYEDRPIACRKYFVTSDPKICGADEAEVTVAFSPQTEILYSAYTGVDKEIKGYRNGVTSLEEWFLYFMR